MYDFLIIGHGLAGAVLSQSLLEKGYHVKVFDQPDKNNSSMIAAGLYNPVTGRKMVKTWLADKLFPEIEPMYSNLEKRLGAKFLHSIGIYRPFVDAGEQNDWEGKKTDPTFRHFIKDLAKTQIEEFDLNDVYGGLHLSCSGFLDIPTLLEESRKVLIAHDAYAEEDVDEHLLKIESGKMTYKETSFKKLIFCNGLGAMNSELFNWVPFRPVKGEVLIGNVSKNISRIYNRGIFIVPAGEKKVKVGSTYRNHFSDAEPTVEGQNELIEKLGNLSSEKFEMTAVQAGLRPATKDRRPFIGKHPEYEHIYLFNGFGSKGVSLVPYFSKNFIEYLEGKSTLDEDVDILRYNGLYKKS